MEIALENTYSILPWKTHSNCLGKHIFFILFFRSICPSVPVVSWWGPHSKEFAQINLVLEVRPFMLPLITLWCNLFSSCVPSELWALPCTNVIVSVSLEPQMMFRMIGTHGCWVELNRNGQSMNEAWWTIQLHVCKFRGNYYWFSFAAVKGEHESKTNSW